MTYQWEWVSDLAIIPAWECFLTGFLCGILVTLLIIVVFGGKG